MKRLKGKSNVQFLNDEVEPRGPLPLGGKPLAASLWFPPEQKSICARNKTQRFLRRIKTQEPIHEWKLGFGNSFDIRIWLFGHLVRMDTIR